MVGNSANLLCTYEYAQTDIDRGQNTPRGVSQPWKQLKSRKPEKEIESGRVSGEINEK